MPITFIKEGHKYIHNATGKNLVSATTFISEFFEKFDTEKWSKHIADRDNMTVQAVLDMWERKKNASCEFGTSVHNYAESLIKKTEAIVPSTEREKMYFGGVNKFMKTENHKFFDAEMIIGSPVYELAGQIDALSKTKQGIFLIDWKTNKSIDQHGFRDKRSLEPIQHMQDCNYSKYSLQLSLYRYILEKEYKWEVAGQILVHLLPSGEYVKYEVPYLKDEIEGMLGYKGRL